MIYQAFCHFPLGEAQMLASRLEEAQVLAEHTLALARAHQERGDEAYTLRLLGEIAARREPRENASLESCYRGARALAEKLGMRPLQAHAHVALSTLSVKIGGRNRTRTELMTAIELYRAMAITFWLPWAEVALARVEAHHDRAYNLATELS
jgi:hypothetical protein